MLKLSSRFLCGNLFINIFPSAIATSLTYNPRALNHSSVSHTQRITWNQLNKATTAIRLFFVLWKELTFLDSVKVNHKKLKAQHNSAPAGNNTLWGPTPRSSWCTYGTCSCSTSTEFPAAKCSRDCAAPGRGIPSSAPLGLPGASIDNWVLLFPDCLLKVKHHRRVEWQERSFNLHHSTK